MGLLDRAIAVVLSTVLAGGAHAATQHQVRPDSRIEVVYLTAPDCVYCKSWRYMRTGDWSRFADSPAGREVKLVTVEKQTLRMPIEKRHYPEALAKLHDVAPQFGNVVPAWWVVLDGVPVMRRLGENRWREEIEPVLEQLVKAKQAGGGVYAYAPAVAAMPKKLAERPQDVAGVPYLTESGRRSYASFLAKPSPRAFALSADGAHAWRSGGEDPAKKALDNCNARSELACRLFVVDDKVVFRK
jgi:hypothetical protein